MGIRYDIVDGVINTGVDDVYDLKLRANKLNSYLEKKLEEVMITLIEQQILLKSQYIKVQKNYWQKKKKQHYIESFNNIEKMF